MLMLMLTHKKITGLAYANNMCPQSLEWMGGLFLGKKIVTDDVS